MLRTSSALLYNKNVDEGDVVDKLYIIKRAAAIRKQAGSASKAEEKIACQCIIAHYKIKHSALDVLFI